MDVETIAEKLSVSPTTIRRDLQMFEKQHLINRYHGGAQLLEGTLKEEDPSLEPPTPRNISQKHAIAKYAATLIEDGDTIVANIVGSSSTIFRSSNEFLYEDPDIEDTEEPTTETEQPSTDTEGSTQTTEKSTEQSSEQSLSGAGTATDQSVEHTVNTPLTQN